MWPTILPYLPNLIFLNPPLIPSSLVIVSPTFIMTVASAWNMLPAEIHKAN